MFASYLLRKLLEQAFDKQLISLAITKRTPVNDKQLNL